MNNAAFLSIGIALQTLVVPQLEIGENGMEVRLVRRINTS